MIRRIESPLSFALAILATCLLYLSSLAIPLAGILLIPLVPQPSLAYGLRHGKGQGIVLLLASCGLLSLIGGTEAALGFLLTALLVVFLFSFFGRGLTIEIVVGGTALGMLLATSTALLFLFGSFSQLLSGIGQSLRESVELSLMIYEKAGLSAETIELARARSPQVIDMLLQILPAVTFIAFVTIILFNLVLLSYRFPEHRGSFLSIGDTKEWKAPEPVIWFLILSGFWLVLPDEFLPAGLGSKALAMNLLLIALMFYFFQGLAIVAYFFHHKRIPLFLRGLGYGFIALEYLATLSVVGLGLFDLWGDFRRLKKRDLNETEET